MNLSDSSLLDVASSPPVAPTETAELLGAVFEALPEGLYLFDTERRLCRLNHASSLLENAAPSAALIGRRCCEMFWRVEGAAECLVERALELGEKVQVEMLAGGDRPVLVSAIPLRDAQGLLTGSVMVIAHDVSELRRVEAEAFEHKAFMASLADIIPDEIYRLDLAGHINWMNERATSANGLMFTALLGRPFSELVSPEAREQANANLKRTWDGDAAEGELQILRADGELRSVEAHSSPLWKDGLVAGALVFLRDMTERKRADERLAQSDKLRAVGELAAGVAHNLNNSLTVIKGRAQLLQRRATDEATVKSLDVIVNAVADGAQTLRRILEFARRDARDKEFSPVDLAELVTATVEIARPRWQSKYATRAGRINVHVENQGPVRVLGEKAELCEVVLNLLFNAVDAMPDGGTIETGTRAELDAACFWVADTGSGIPPDVIARIFEPFYTTKGESGTGLGLSASHGIITRHSGHIMVVSEPGEGTRFEVRLPLYESEAP